MLFERIIITCSAAIQGHRSTSAIFNIITGKKSIQTVQDMHIYQLGHFYGIYKDLTKQTFDQQLELMIRQQWLIRRDEATVITSETGLDVNHGKTQDLHQFKGLQYHKIEPIFTKRLLLLVQTLTNAVHKNLSFIPVVDETDITNWIKRIYRRIDRPQRILQLLYRELLSLLQEVDDQQANLFTDRLTGYQHYAKSVQQLADLYNLSAHDVRLSLVKTHHQLLHKITTQHTHSLLRRLLEDIGQTELMTHSAVKTYYLLRQGQTLNMIAEIRDLKLNTIHDHLVEIVYFDAQLSLDPYVPSEARKKIVQAIHQTPSKRLKDIKGHLGEAISYFQIRLVMATLQRTGDTDGVNAIGK